MNDSFLSQEEIDALLQQTQDGGDGQDNVRADVQGDKLQDDYRDALGEIGNISMGSAATALSQLLNQRVTITTPRISVTTAKELSDSFSVPYLLVEIKFVEGLEGSNVLVMQVKDAVVIADLMMGGDGTNAAANEMLSEIATSAVAEAMNQMMGSSATSMSTIFSKGVVISPPNMTPVDFSAEIDNPFEYPEDMPLVVIAFDFVIGDLVNSEMMQVIPLPVAKEQVEMLLSTSAGEAAGQPENPQETKPQLEEKEAEPVKGDTIPPLREDRPSPSETVEAPRNLDLILDVPLRVSVILGKTKKPIREVLKMVPGAIVELEKLANEPVEILVNGTLIAQGEVVVINENFGVRLTHIVSPRERLQNLRNE